MLLIRQEVYCRTTVFTGVFVSVLLVAAGTCFAQEKNSPLSSAQTPLDSSHCLRYRAKKDGVPVYNEPDLSSGFKRKLRIGEVVCYVGEKNNFAIVDGRFRDSEKTLEVAEKNAPIEYVRLSYLWPPRSGPGSDTPDVKPSVGSRGKQQVFRPRVTAPAGSVPEDVFAPFRSFLGLSPSEPECLAGAICEKVKQKLEADKVSPKAGENLDSGGD
jgi:hypothetical protein